MNTASLENCKKLYELSGWDNTYWWHKDGTKFNRGMKPMQIVVPRSHELSVEICPAYDSGFLLRKLPSMLEDEDDKGSYYTLHLGKEGEKDYYANYWHFDNPLVGIDILEPSSTPEDAACLLAIKLFEEAVL